MTKNEKAERYDALMTALEYHEKRYDELSKRIEKSLPEGGWGITDAFDYGRSRAYSYIAKDIRMMTQGESE